MFAFLTSEWKSYLGMDFDDATLTASVQKKGFPPGFDKTVNPLNNLYVVHPDEFRSTAFLKILTVPYMYCSRLHSG